MKNVTHDTLVALERRGAPLASGSSRVFVGLVLLGLIYSSLLHGAWASTKSLLVEKNIATIHSKGRQVLARVTFYHPDQDRFGDETSTGTRLKPWESCAVDPQIIPYGSTVAIPGIGHLVANDTGAAVVSRRAAQGFNPHCIVVDVCVRDAAEVRRMAHDFPPVVMIRVL